MQYSISDYILDLTQNCIEAGADSIIIDIIEEGPFFRVCIGDNGSGMDEETLQKALDPFYTDNEKHKNRKVGLGLPFIIQAIEATGGTFNIKSDIEIGTSVEFIFDTTHIDTPPCGDLSSLFRSLMLFDGDYELCITHKKNGRSYRVCRDELRDALGGFEDGESLSLIKKYFSSNEEELDEVET